MIAIAQGSSELNISFVVDESQAAEAARAVHGAFQLSKIGGGRAYDRAVTDVVLLGFGRVGRALAEMTAASGGGRIRIVAALDRSGYVFDPRGLSRARLARLAGGKDDGVLLKDLGGREATAAEALRWIAAHAVSRPVLVDVTAEETGDLLTEALGQGFDLVLANKKPLAGSPAAHRRLLDTVAASGRRVRYEATVGAGLPVIDTFRKLVDSGDRVLRIEGCVSGTLGYVLSAVEGGKPFSQAVKEAMRPRLHRARPTRGPDRPGRAAQGAHPRAAAGLRRAGADGREPGARRRCASCRSSASSRSSRRSTTAWQARVAQEKKRAAACCATWSSPRRASCRPALRRCPASRRSARSRARATCCRSPRAATAASRSSWRVPARVPR